MRKRLVGWLYHWDGEYLWCYDEKICALSRININTMDVICMVSPMHILKDKWYEAGNLIGWDNKIIIVPLEIGNEWVIYDKQNGNVEYDIFCTETYQSMAGNVIGNNFIILPSDVNHPVLSIDLQRREVIKKIDLQNFGLVPESSMIILDAKTVEGSIYFLIKNSRFYGKIDNKDFQLVRIQGEGALECADFYKDIGWAVDRKGSFLYQFDKEGNLIREFPINADLEPGRIAAENKSVFLLPVNQQQIKVFDVDKNQIKSIDVQQEKGDLSILETFGSAGYWEYMKKGQEMWLLPWRYSLQVVNMSTFICSQKEFLYMDDFSVKEYTKYYRYVRKLRKPLYYEKKDLEKYLSLVLMRENDFISEQENETYYGKKIWKILK